MIDWLVLGDPDHPGSDGAALLSLSEVSLITQMAQVRPQISFLLSNWAQDSFPPESSCWWESGSEWEASEARDKLALGSTQRLGQEARPWGGGVWLGVCCLAVGRPPKWVSQSRPLRGLSQPLPFKTQLEVELAGFVKTTYKTAVATCWD